MKQKILNLLIALCFSMSSFAQAGHLSFRGISIDGTIDQFESQLLQQDVEYDAEASIASSDTRIYRGKYLDRDAMISVTFDVVNRIVYACTVTLSDVDSSKIADLYHSTTLDFARRYSNHFVIAPKIKDGYPAQNLALKRYPVDFDYAWERCYGTILISCAYSTQHYGKLHHELNIQFTDQLNMDKHVARMEADKYR